MFSPEETIRAIRASLVGEEDAISQYDAQVEMIKNPLVRQVLSKISSEEKVHQGELITLLSTLGRYAIKGRGSRSQGCYERAG